MINNRLSKILDICKSQENSFPIVNLVNGVWPWRDLIKSAKSRAKKKGLKFDLNDDWARQRFTGYCEMSGLPFGPAGGKRNMFSISIDRIKHGEGYTRDNARFILWGLNAMRGANGSDNDMIKICHAIALDS